MSHQIVAEVQGIVNPITAKLYNAGGSGSGSSAKDEEEMNRNHDEL